MRKPRYRGFTLVELLVVIAIITVLTGLGAFMLPKALKKGAQTKVVGGMRQMTSALEMYAKDHSNRIPPPVTSEEDSEIKQEILWFAHLEQLNSGHDIEDYLKDKWWKANKTSIYINPMQPKKNITAKSTGYAMNAALAMNIAVSRGEKMQLEDAKYTPVNLNTVKDAVRTPIIIPHWTWFYVGDKREMADKRFQPFLVNDRMPVLFLDSHIETLTPAEYAKKGLNLVPKSEDGESN